MRTGVPETRRRRTWYGLTAQVTLGARFLHWSGFGGIRVPHPPVANGLLRIGLPDEGKRRLSFDHEFAHFQTGPAALVYMIVLLAAVHVRGRISMEAILIALASTHAVWEILSECLVVIEDRSVYRALYKGISILPRILFWVFGAALAAVGWAGILLPATS